MDYKILKDLSKLIVETDKPPETKINGTIKERNGVKYVRLDGSEIYTPIDTAVEIEDGDKVVVEIKDHKATILSNITSPSVGIKSFNTLKDKVDENGNKINLMNNAIEALNSSVSIINSTVIAHDSAIQSIGDAINSQGNAITMLRNSMSIVNNNISAMNNKINLQDSRINTISSSISAVESDISLVQSALNVMGSRVSSINDTVQSQGNLIVAINNKINLQDSEISAISSDINLVNSDIAILNSGFVIQDGVLTGLSEIIVDNLKTDYLNSAYADIDFANIDIAAIATLFSESGIINDLVVQQGAITGELVGVTLKGDLIEANTLKADKIVVRGSDGLYYKLNIDGIDNISTSEAGKFTLTTSKPSDWDTNYKDYYIISNSNYTHVTGASAPTWSTNTYYKLNSDHESGLDGSTIIAHSVTADRIQVTDLVAFGATIGGFVIGNAAIYSLGKTSINSNTNGIYLGSDGQIYIGDQNNHVKYYKDGNNNWILDIRASSIYMGSSSKTIEAEIDDINKDLASKEMIVGTQSAATNVWTGVAPFDTLTDGTEILYWLPFDGTSSNATLNLTLSNGQTTGAKNVYYSGTTRVTTQYKAGNPLRMVYRSNVVIGTSTCTGWWCDANYDTNDTDRIRYKSNIKTDQTYCQNSRLIAANEDNLYAVMRRGYQFKIDSPILYVGTNLNPLTTGTNNYLMYSAVNIVNTLTYNCKIGNQTVTSSTKGYAGTVITDTTNKGVAGVLGDIYINTSTYKLYKCTTAGTATTAIWTYQESLAATAGDKWYSGSTAPSVTGAAAGDYYYRTDNGHYYEYVNSAWSDKGVLIEQYKTLYLRGSINDGIFTIDKIPFTTVMPTQEDNLYYISLGSTYSLTAFGLFAEHPIYKYVVDGYDENDNPIGGFKPTSQISVDAQSLAVNSVSKTDYEAQISELSDTIDLKVSQTTYTTGLEDITKTFTSDLKQTSDDLSLNFSQSIQRSLGDINDPNSINGTVSNINQNFLFSNSGLTISRSDSAMMLVLQNNEIDFVLKGNTNTVKAKITSNSFILEELSTLQLGNFAFVVRSNGSIDFKKVK